jgi:hypothetical protein
MELSSLTPVFATLGLRMPKEQAMPFQIVMDHSGDSRYEFSVDDAQSLARAESRFEQLVGQGYIAAARENPGQARRLKAFDPKAEETLFFPRLVGG